MICEICQQAPAEVEEETPAAASSTGKAYTLQLCRRCYLAPRPAGDREPANA